MLVYLAAPYSSIGDKESHMRYIMKCMGRFMVKYQNEYMVSPLTNHFSLGQVPELGTDWEFWEGFSETLMARCDKLVVLQMNGTEESTGVQAEIALAKKMGIPVVYWDSLDDSITRNRRLTSEEIASRIKEFNETNDWSVFNDVPALQQVNVMYPHTFKLFDPELAAKVTETGKAVLNEMYGPISKLIEEQS